MTSNWFRVKLFSHFFYFIFGVIIFLVSIFWDIFNLVLEFLKIYFWSLYF